MKSGDARDVQMVSRGSVKAVPEIAGQAETAIETGTVDELMKNQSWCTGNETDPEWNEYLHSYDKTWTNLLIVVCLPSAIIFSVSVITSMVKGGWYALSMGGYYNDPSDPFQFYKLPMVLWNHFWMAVFMLMAIFVQVYFAFRGVRQTGEARRKTFEKHKKFGPVAVFFVGVAVTLGTIALGLCDIQPKRSAETIFFVAIGVCILVATMYGVMFVSKKKTGLHMQYMFFACAAIFSPGWNRITTLFIRLIKGALDGPGRDCFYVRSWSKVGYTYTWSFLAGLGWMFAWWLLPCSPFRAPFFKKYSVGFWLIAFQAFVMSACLFEMFVSFEPMDLNCNDGDMANFLQFSKAAKVNGIFQFNSAYGLCSPYFTKNEEGTMQGVPGAFLNDPTVINVNSGFENEVEHFLEEHESVVNFVKLLEDAGVHLDLDLAAELFPNLNIDEAKEELAKQQLGIDGELPTTEAPTDAVVTTPAPTDAVVTTDAPTDAVVTTPAPIVTTPAVTTPAPTVDTEDDSDTGNASG